MVNVRQPFAPRQVAPLPGAVLAVSDQAPDDPDARFQLVVLHVVTGAADEVCGALRSLVTEGRDHADELLASLAHFASNGPVTSAPDFADSHLWRTR